MNDFNKEVRVSNPSRVQDVVFYEVMGRDTQGTFEVKRRYSDFEALRDCWRRRFPGMLLPFLPPKRYINNTEQAHIEERCFLLEQFMRKVSRLPYLVNSIELHTFARHNQAEVPMRKALDLLPPLSAAQISQRVKLANQGFAEPITQASVSRWLMELDQTRTFTRAHLDRITEISSQLKKQVTGRDEYIVQNSDYVVGEICQYEKSNLKGY